MNERDLLQILARGEDSRHQFKPVEGASAADIDEKVFDAYFSRRYGQLPHQPLTNRRNPTLTEHATHILPYRGLGSGIPRALGEWPDIRFEDEVAGNQFKAVIARPQSPAQIVAPVGIGSADTRVTPEVTPEVGRVVRALSVDLSRQELQNALGLKDDEHFRKAYLLPALSSG